VLPFATAAVLATTVSAFVALSVTSQAMESRLEAQVANAASLVARSDFALNVAILRSVQAITGADVVTFSADGSILATTIDRSRDDLAAAVVQAVRSSQGGPGSTPGVMHLSCLSEPCAVAVRSLTSPPGVQVAIVAVTSDLMAATRVVTRTILATAALCALLMVVVSEIVARRVTAPLDALVVFASGVSDETDPARARTGPDEIGRLGAAFNAMLDRLEQSRHALVRSEKLALAGLIAARVAHDIRNPLSSIKMLSQLLRARLDPTSDPSLRETADAIVRDTAQVESVVADLLEVARPGELARRPARINDVVDDVLRQMAPQLAHRKMMVETQLGADIPEAPLDAARLRQVLVNVINNATDAMAAGGTLTVATSWNRAASTIGIDVCDDGVGIDPALRDRLFDPFVTTKHGGVGLGLVNAKAVVERHGGSIALEPRAPRGTRVSMTLPLGTRNHG